MAQARQIDEMFERRGPLRARNRAGEIIPTWQVGQEQFPPHDLLRQAQTGYSQNSLIYSCIYEKQTSFATVRPMLTRADGQVQDQHRMVRLLRNPAPGWNWQRFQSTQASHLDVGGNVYIHKVRQSSDLERRRLFDGYPVQELRLIRPDKVTVEPGRSSAEDVFRVTVAGQLRARIPRRDMIHIHEDSLVDDFYGLSKIAILAREGSIDLAMSDMELSFFRNAGVPAGLLKVKGNPNPEETEEIKSKFRSAFNGVKRWFDVLVLNERVTDYQQLALKQSEMTKPETRDRVESRICGVLGVPGRLVGALFAVGASNSAGTYEQDQFQFWSETMLPLGMLFGGFYASDLLPEFATTRDRDAQVGYDYTGVRALQEDLSRKLREVVRMVNSGFIVNDALRLVGLDPLEGYDVRMLTGNQLIVDREHNVLFAGSGAAGDQEEPDNPLEGAASIPSVFRGALD